MILTEKKSVDDIKANFKNSKKVLIIGCETCATLTQSGGEEQVKEMTQLLSDARARKFRKPHRVIFSI